VKLKEKAIANSPMRRWSDVADDLFSLIVRYSDKPSQPNPVA
jgi:hypothetical protein